MQFASLGMELKSIWFQTDLVLELSPPTRTSNGELMSMTSVRS